MPSTSSTSLANSSHTHPSSAHAPTTSNATGNTPSTSIITPAGPAPRARPQNARKRAAQADDAAYHAAAGTKRPAADRADGDRERTKRKRVDTTILGAGVGTQGNLGGTANAGNREERVSLLRLYMRVAKRNKRLPLLILSWKSLWSPGRLGAGFQWAIQRKLLNFPW
ncbi:hypothetical protein BD414DRAFT_508378 [Trametes punicea]|nr:hypothetical protein BD414DRAFT_508378 [Trametes punicea]